MMIKSSIVVSLAAIGLAAWISAFTLFSNGSSSHFKFDQKNVNGNEASLFVLYSKWVAKYGKKIPDSPSELKYRIEQFSNSLKSLPLFRASNPDATYSLTEYADLNDLEYSNLFFEGQKSQNPHNLKMQDSSDDNSHLPDSTNAMDAAKNWGYKDQGRYGTCYAQVVAQMIESFLGFTVKVSAQHIVNCLPYNQQLPGGSLYDALLDSLTDFGYKHENKCKYKGKKDKCSELDRHYLQDVEILKLNSCLWPTKIADYPIKNPTETQLDLIKKYRQSKGEYSTTHSRHVQQKQNSNEKSSFVHIPENKRKITVQGLKGYLSKGIVFGVNVQIDLKKEKLRSSGSIYSDKGCKSNTTNHAMLLIGYEKGDWLLQNSWGKKNIPVAKVNIIEEFPVYNGHKCFCGGAIDMCSATAIIHKSG